MDLRNEKEEIDRNNDNQRKSEFYSKIFSFHNLMLAAIILVCLYAFIYWIYEYHSDKINTFVNIAFCEVIVLAFLGGMAVLAIRYLIIIRDIIQGKEKRRTYFVSALTLLVCSLLVLRLFSFSVNDILDLLSDGQLFIWPVFFLIIISALLIVVVIFESLFSPEVQNKVSEMAEKILRRVVKIAAGIIESLLDQIEFVLLDCFPFIKNMVLGEADVEDFEAGDQKDASKPNEIGIGEGRTNTGAAERAGLETKEAVE